jgi:alginate production protein
MALQGEPESKMENNPVNLGDRDQRRLEGIRIIDLGKVVTARSLAFALTLIGVPAGAVEAKGVIKEKQGETQNVEWLFQEFSDWKNGKEGQAAKARHRPVGTGEAHEAVTSRDPGRVVTPGVAGEEQVAQFQLPQTTPGGAAPETQLPQRLTYQYDIGSESGAFYRRDADLDRRLRDDTLILVPQLNGYITYRPTDWLEATLEMVVEREIPVLEESLVRLPNGETMIAPQRRLSAVVDQAYVTIQNVIDPFDVTIGRLNFEDERHWLYDTSMDVVSASYRQGPFRAQATVGREVLTDLDLVTKQQSDRNNTYMLYADWRGIEGSTLAAYTIMRDDQDGLEGKPQHYGLRAIGVPFDTFSYWAEAALLRGRDETGTRLSGHAFDVGGTIRFPELPLYPSLSVGYAFATGDHNPNDGVNQEFRQTGLQSNETRLAGVPDFKVYGEALDPELSNLHILTAGLGVRPTPDSTLEFVYHRYWLDEPAEELRNSAITALMNQFGSRTSQDVGSGFDVVYGVRNLFGVRSLGIDLRAGWFFPGDAFANRERVGRIIRQREPDKGVAISAKFWW